MDGEWQHQIRLRIADGIAETARRDPTASSLAPLPALLARHDAALVCQYDAFADYVAEAERQGIDRFPLHAWTKATIEDPAKKEKYLRSFTVHVGGAEVYSGETADALEVALKPLVGGSVIAAMTRHDTNPSNNPRIPKRFRT